MNKLIVVGIMVTTSTARVPHQTNVQIIVRTGQILVLIIRIQVTRGGQESHLLLHRLTIAVQPNIGLTSLTNTIGLML